MINKVLVVGFGNIGKRHYKLLKKKLPKSEIKILKTKNTKIEKGFSKSQYINENYLEEFLPDISIISNPAPFHLYYAEKLLKLNSNIFIEKPLSDSDKKINLFLKKTKSSSASVTVGYNLRFLDSLIELKKLVDENIIGTIYSVKCDAGQYLPEWRNSDYRKSVSAKKSLGGGVLLELSHEIDYLNWIFGKISWVNSHISKISNLEIDVGKLALSTALCIIYPDKGYRDDFCTAIAGVLLNHTKWKPEEIDDFIYRIAVIAKDHDPDKRNNKGTSHAKAQRKLGMPTIAQSVGDKCSVSAIQTLFSWVGITNEAVEGQAAIGDIIEYGQNRYLVKVNAVVNDKPKQVQIIVTGPTLMKQHLFYDEVISQASVWVPKMKPVEFEKIMRAKYEARSRSENYVEEANENLRFKKYFKSYIRKEKAYTDKKELYNHKLPYFDLGKSSIQFNLDMFEDYLESQKINMKRVDLVMKIQMILEGKKIHGKDSNNKSFVYWKIDKPDIDKEDILVEGEVVEEVQQIDYEA